jgi:hypothetical protein
MHQSSDDAPDIGVFVWDVVKGGPPRRLPARGLAPVTAFAFSQTGRLLAAGGVDGALQVWDVVHGRSVLAVSAWLPEIQARVPLDATIMMGRRVRGLAILGDDRTLLVGWHRGAVYRLPGRLPVRTIEPFFFADVLALEDGAAYFGHVGEQAGFVDGKTLQAIEEVTLDPPGTGVRVGHGRQVVVGTQDDGLTLLEPGHPARRLLRPPRPLRIGLVYFSPDDRKLHVVSYGYGEAVLPDGARTAGSLIWDSHKLDAEREKAGPVTALAEAGVVLDERAAKIRDEAGHETALLTCPDKLGDHALSADRRLLALTCAERGIYPDDAIRLFDLSRGGAPLGTLVVYDEGAAELRLPDGRLEMLGPDLRDRALCRVGEIVLPFEVCEGRALRRGVLAAALAGQGAGAALRCQAR